MALSAHVPPWLVPANFLQSATAGAQIGEALAKLQLARQELAMRSMSRGGGGGGPTERDKLARDEFEYKKQQDQQLGTDLKDFERGKALGWGTEDSFNRYLGKHDSSGNLRKQLVSDSGPNWSGPMNVGNSQVLQWDTQSGERRELNPAAPPDPKATPLDPKAKLQADLVKQQLLSIQRSMDKIYADPGDTEEEIDKKNITLGQLARQFRKKQEEWTALTSLGAETSTTNAPALPQLPTAKGYIQGPGGINLNSPDQMMGLPQNVQHPGIIAGGAPPPAEPWRGGIPAIPGLGGTSTNTPATTNRVGRFKVIRR